MEVILREDVPGLGMIGDVVRVRPGHARNYLLPRGIAVVADRRNLKQVEHHKREIEKKRLSERGTVERVAEALEGTVIEVEARAGRGGRLFGSVTNMELAKQLAERDFDIDRRRIELKEPIKSIGEHEVTVRVGQDIRTAIKVVVSPLGGVLEEEPDEPAPIPTDGQGEGTEDGESSADADDSEAKDAGDGDAAASEEAAAEDATPEKSDGSSPDE